MMLDFASDLRRLEGAGKPLEGEMRAKRIGKISRARAWPDLNCYWDRVGLATGHLQEEGLVDGRRETEG